MELMFSEYFQPGGFFFEVRKKNFSEAKSEEVVGAIKSIEVNNIDDAEWINIAKSIWDFPFFARMYRDRCVENGADEKKYDAFTMDLYQATERILRRA
ncbi:hypothetical protein SLT36_30240 (plasmid) [Aminobacter sp. BA135]|uniref:hypothetical protein n=1 Tax=Aminobacter sp. BA135 TaxID=537596 RepID=UPI003D7A7D0B